MINDSLLKLMLLKPLNVLLNVKVRFAKLRKNNLTSSFSKSSFTPKTAMSVPLHYLLTKEQTAF